MRRFRSWCYRHGVRWHVQNLTDGERDPLWRHGGAWVNVWRGDGETGVGYREILEINPEWHVEPRASAGVGLQVGGGDSDREVMLHLDAGIARLYLTFDGLPRAWAERVLPGYWIPRGGPYGPANRFDRGGPARLKITQPMEIDVRWHDGALWWSLWHSVHEWSSRTPRWRHGNVSPVDCLLGRQRHSERPIRTVETEVPMPEKTYPALVLLFESTWKRPRWPFARKMLRATIEVGGGVPHPGKGENSWDCGEDATFSLTCPARTPEQAVGRLVESVLRDRRRYGGKDWRPQEQLAA